MARLRERCQCAAGRCASAATGLGCGMDGTAMAAAAAGSSGTPSPALAVATAHQEVEENSDIFAAALRGDLEMVRSLLPARDSRMASGGYSALGLAVSAGHEQVRAPCHAA
mmetsp:Transcript_11428/g.35285  ORF Transcript_11428/g.35285 Transcript_11428/m.35285 type:complete len:111 (+) Transcript_11428:1626-1958(+)